MPKVRNTRGSSSEKTKKTGSTSDRKSPALSSGRSSPATAKPVDELNDEDQKKVPSTEDSPLHRSSGRRSGKE